jgi:hypothetical protein
VIFPNFQCIYLNTKEKMSTPWLHFKKFPSLSGKISRVNVRNKLKIGFNLTGTIGNINQTNNNKNSKNAKWNSKKQQKQEIWNSNSHQIKEVWIEEC